MTPLRFTLLASAAIAFSCCAGNIPTFAQTGSTQSAPDNTKQNKNQTPTADNQPDARADRLTTANIRKSIIADKTLSTYAHNVKIITVNGAVTLKGPVKSEDEKQKIASDAASVISADKVTNELTVKP